MFLSFTVSDVLMVDFDVTLTGASYSCISIASTLTSGPYTKQIGYNFKIVSGSSVASNIMEVKILILFPNGQ